ncbi:MAG: ABC transporter substrate-binding protein [Sedimenticola sp.]|nr:ABC transporter substrate-binding protein [Sedimenticola sp.]
MMARWFLLLVYLLSAMPGQAGERPQRITSINLCTDQLLMLLADSEQIASITDLSLEPNSSYLADEAVRYRVNYRRPEEILAQQPDLIIAGEYSPHGLLELFEKLGYRVERLPISSNIEMIRANIRTMAQWVGHPERGERLIRQMDERIARVSANRPGVPPKAAFYQPNGYTSGSNTLQHAALLAAGWRNLPAELGIQGYGDILLEQLLLLQPDQLFTSSYAPGTDSLAQKELGHPVLKRLTRGQPIINIGYKYWICGGPMIAEAIEELHRSLPR